MTWRPDTREKRSRTWRRWLVDAVDVLRLMFSWRGVGRPRADARGCPSSRCDRP